jgi:hypothetical protein
MERRQVRAFLPPDLAFWHLPSGEFREFIPIQAAAPEVGDSAIEQKKTRTGQHSHAIS